MEGNSFIVWKTPRKQIKHCSICMSREKNNRAELGEALSVADAPARHQPIRHHAPHIPKLSARLSSSGITPPKGTLLSSPPPLFFNLSPPPPPFLSLLSTYLGPRETCNCILLSLYTSLIIMASTDPTNDELHLEGEPAPELLEGRIWVDGCFDFFHHGTSLFIYSSRYLLSLN